MRSLPPLLYISGPITGVSGYNFLAFSRAEGVLKWLGYRVFNPNDLSDLDNDRSLPREVYLRRDIQALMRCGGLVLLPDWLRSKGARMEVHVTQSLGIPVFLYQENWDGCPRRRVIFNAIQKRYVGNNLILEVFVGISGVPGTKENS